jgi:DNA-binding ferritin-like protein (Dps family)
MNDIKKLIKKNYELSKKLNPENDKIYTDILVYLRFSTLDELEAEEVIQDILGMFLEAQQRGEKIEKVIGEGYQAFCDSIIESARPTKFIWKKAFLNPELIVMFFGILWVIDLVCNFIFELFVNRRFILDYQVSLGFLIVGAINTTAIFWILDYLRKTSFKKDNFKDTLLLVTVWVGVVALDVFIWQMQITKSYVLFTMKIYYLAALFIGLYLLAKAVSKAFLKQR